MPTRSLRDEFKSVFGEALDTLNQLTAAEATLASLEGSTETSDMAAMETALEEMARLQEEARRQDAYSIDANVRNSI